jgi:hypothetical protein
LGTADPAIKTTGGSGWAVETQRLNNRQPLMVLSDTKQSARLDTEEQTYGHP